ncbi:MAG TPA: hypothetical protein VGE01_15090, partial [Fimbriimonas sp.]
IPIEGPIAMRFAYLPVQSNERLVAAGNGTFRARGLVWDMQTAPTQLKLVYPDGREVELFAHDPLAAPITLSPADSTFDRDSGLITFTSRLGGRLTLDPSQGTVRFGSGTIPANATLMLTYRPTFLRMSVDSGGNGYTSPSALFDDRYITPDVLNWVPARPIPYWFLADGSQVRAGTNRANNRLTHDRYMLFYGRSAASAGQAARPFMNTMRLGVRLSDPMVDPTTNQVYPVRVVGNTGPYEIDPAQNRVYFTALDEDRPVQVYLGTSGTPSFAGLVGFVQETGQQEVPIEQAVNEQSMMALVDPFVYPNVNNLRPPLVWLFWSSTRAGNPDVYFQTIAPHIAVAARR